MLAAIAFAIVGVLLLIGGAATESVIRLVAGALLAATLAITIAIRWALWPIPYGWVIETILASTLLAQKRKSARVNLF